MLAADTVGSLTQTISKEFSFSGCLLFLLFFFFLIKETVFSLSHEQCCWSRAVFLGFHMELAGSGWFDLAHVSIFEPIAVVIGKGVTAGLVLSLCLHLGMT